MRTKNLAFLTALLLSAVMLWGCGSNGSGGALPEQPGLEDAALVGSSSCRICHVEVLADGWDGSAHDLVSAGCEGCHGGGQFHRGIGPMPYPQPGLDQCAQCHVVNAHFDDPATTDIEGYVITRCEDCHYSRTPAQTVQWAHNPAALDINREWANSAHGGFIAQVKANDPNGAVTRDIAAGWVYYNWDQSTGTGNRLSCQRCHTATGIANFLDDPANYNPLNNDFSHLVDWTPATGSPQNEMLYCWGCHSDVATGGLRNPGAITEVYAAINNPGTGTTGTPATVVYPDIDASNVCMGCHLGREVGQNIKNITDDNGVLNFVNSHYLAAGGQIFNTSGYHYGADADYEGFGFHKNVGMADLLGTGSAGPCVTCHMTGPEPHTFIAAAANASCASCHGGLTDAILDTARDEFSLALAELNAALAANGIHFGESHPYFFTAPFVPGGTNTGFTDWISVAQALDAPDPANTGWQHVMGAAFNYNLLKHDPGAYAHNKQYALKLIADSIDFLDDGLVNNSTAATSLAAQLLAANQPLSTLGFAPVHDLVTLPDYTNCGACHTASPHYTGNNDPPATGDPNNAQYVDTNRNVCTDCHAPGYDEVNLPILREWAESGHGSYGPDKNGIWRATTGCAPCHGPHTLANQINPGAVVANDRRQNLACYACHSDVGEGEVRFTDADLTEAGSYTFSWTSNGILVELDYINYGTSHLCVRCHGGSRAQNTVGIGAQIIEDSFITGAHYRVVGPTLLSNLGYAFPGQTYPVGGHQLIGLGAGNAGPCVTCHMAGDSGHTWRAVEKDEAGQITAITSSSCVSCHPGMTAATLQGYKDEFQVALDALETAFNAKDIYYNPAGNGSFHQSFDPATGTFGVAVNNAYLDTVISNHFATVDPAVTKTALQGVLYNFRVFTNYRQDPGGYVHNWRYALTLVAHSIDYIQNGVIDGPLVAPNPAYQALAQ